MYKVILPLLITSTLFSVNTLALSTEIESAYGTNLDRYQAQEPSTKNSGTSLKTVSLNLGLLQSPSEVPNFDQRSRLLQGQLSEFLSNASPDIMFLQEAWDDTPENITSIRSAASQNNYLSIQALFESSPSYTSAQARNGLDILVKKNILKDASKVMEISFSEIARSSMAAIGGYDRGVLHAKLTLKNSQTVLAATSHFTPNLAWPTYNQDSTRKKQAVQSANILKTAGANTDYVIIGADMNFSPEFEHKISDGRDSDAKDSVWKASSTTYPLFLNESLLIDTYKVVNSDIGYTQDRALNPMSNVSPSTDGEPEQRLDYIWAGSYIEENSIEISKSYLVFNTPLLNKDGEFIPAEVYNGPLFMSDHFGIATELTLY